MTLPAPSAETSPGAAGLPPALCVLGLGLIGGSLLRAASPAVGDVFGWSPSAETRWAAVSDRFCIPDELDAALDRAASADALVVLASPVTAFESLLTAIGRRAPRVRLTDVAGVKASVAELVAELTPEARYVGSHPMAGTTASGWAAGSAEMFRHRVWVTCLSETTDLDDWAAVAALALAVGSRVVPLEPDAHDDAAARISHLPHLMALALAQVGTAGGSVPLALAAGSFADATRVAATRPALIRAMCETNPGPLVGALDEVLALLGVARASLASTGSVATIAERGHTARLAFDDRGKGFQPITLTGDDLADQLLAIGAAGGSVTGLDRLGGGWRVLATYPAGD